MNIFLGNHPGEAHQRGLSNVNGFFLITPRMSSTGHNDQPLFFIRKNIEMGMSLSTSVQNTLRFSDSRNVVGLIEGQGNTVKLGTEVRQIEVNDEGKAVGVTLADGTKITAGHILVATGGHPIKPDLPGAEHAMVSDDIFQMETLPKSILIIGGGYIACEFACILNGLGVKVTQYYRGAQILRGFDDEARGLIAEMMRLGLWRVHRRCTLSVTSEEQWAWDVPEGLTIEQVNKAAIKWKKDGPSHACEAALYGAMAAILYHLCESCLHLATLLAPVLPGAAAKILGQLRAEEIAPRLRERAAEAAVDLLVENRRRRTYRTLVDHQTHRVRFAHH